MIVVFGKIDFSLAKIRQFILPGEGYMRQLTKNNDVNALNCELPSGSKAKTEVYKSEIKIAAEGIRKVILITEVFGDGQKPSAAALEYSGEIDISSISVDDFRVEGQTIASVYTNSEAALTDRNIPGNYVILNFMYKNTKSPTAMGSRGRKPGGGVAHGDVQKQNHVGVDGGTFRGREQVKMDLSVSVSQINEIMGTDGIVYPRSENAIESRERIDLVLQDFQLLEYTDTDTGCSIPYSLYLPKNYDKTKKYPLLFFVADAGANCDDPTRNLTQGNGATIWANPKEQAKQECIVLSPQYTNTLIDSIGALTTDDNVWSDGLTLVYNLLHYVIETYPIDKNRIYGTGQSQGCMTNIAISDRYPDLFAAQLLVAGQWNVEEMSAMKDRKSVV